MQYPIRPIRAISVPAVLMSFTVLVACGPGSEGASEAGGTGQGAITDPTLAAANPFEPGEPTGTPAGTGEPDSEQASALPSHAPDGTPYCD